MKKTVAILMISILLMIMTGCVNGQAGAGTVTQPAGTSESGTVTQPYGTPESGPSTITLGDKITFTGSGVVVNGKKVTIISAGTYNISGTLKDGQIIVNSEDQETVKLVLEGVDISCSSSAPIYVINAEKTVITLADGTKNSVIDSDSYILTDEASGEPSAAIFSNDDLTINGGGSLTVNASYNNGIQSKDDLKINGGNITINAVNDGLKGRDSVDIGGGTITITAGGDGIQSNNDEDTEKGYINIEAGILDINAGLDGIQAETGLTISGGDITITSGGGSVNSSNNAGAPGNTWGDWGDRNMLDNNAAQDTTPSAKGLKAGDSVTITGGVIKIDSSDDSIHSNNTITITGGTIYIASGDDGVHADTSVEIGGGDINITKSYEGIESSIITLNDGYISLVSSDDGINIVGGNDGSAIDGRPGQNEFAAVGNNHLYINGGYIYINAGGDGIDVNGPIDMTGGTVIVNGPTDNGNGPLDYLNSFNVTGGYLVAAGSSGMAMAPSASSSQYSVMIYYSSAQEAGSLVHIETSDGQDVLTFAPAKTYQSVVLCSPELKNGASYIVYSGGSSTGTEVNGLYSGGEYKSDSQIYSFTISGTVTTLGSAGNAGPGGNMPGGMRR